MKYKKLALLMFSMLFFINLSFVTVFAKDNKDDKEETTTQTTTKSIWEDEKLYDKDFEKKSDNVIKKTIRGNFKFINYNFKQIELMLKSDSQYNFLGGHIIVSRLNQFFLPLGYSVFFICWLLGIAKKSMDLQIYETQGMIKELALLVGGLVFMGLSTHLLSLINATSQNLTTQLLSTNITLSEDLANQWYSDFSEHGNKIPFLSWLIQMRSFFWGNFGAIGFALIMIIVSFIMSLVLGLRVIKLSIFQGVSPVFFGLMGGENTKRYTQNFIVQYCELSFQILILGVLYNSFVTSFMQKNIINNFSATNRFGGYLILAVYCIMFVKSSSLFERVFR